MSESAEIIMIILPVDLRFAVLYAPPRLLLLANEPVQLLEKNQIFSGEWSPCHVGTSYGPMVLVRTDHFGI